MEEKEENRGRKGGQEKRKVEWTGPALQGSRKDKSLFYLDLREYYYIVDRVLLCASPSPCMCVCALTRNGE